MGGPRHGPGLSEPAPQQARRSRSISSRADGAAVFRRLAAKADVIIENYPPRREDAARHRLSDAEQAQPAPRSTPASRASARTGPTRKRPGFDQIAQGMGGLMSITGEPGRGPMRVGIPIADLSGRAVLRARHPGGAARARAVRQGPGGGDLAAAGADLHARLPGLALAQRRAGAGPGRQQPPDQHPDRRVQDQETATSISPRRCGDHWQRLCRAIGAEELHRPSRVRDGGEPAARTAMRSTARSSASSSAAPAPNGSSASMRRRCRAGPIYAINEMFDDPQVKHLDMVQDVETPDERGTLASGGAAGDARRARRAGSSPRRPSAASTTTRCCASSASRLPRSRACARPR